MFRAHRSQARQSWQGLFDPSEKLVFSRPFGSLAIAAVGASGAYCFASTGSGSCSPFSQKQNQSTFPLLGIHSFPGLQQGDATQSREELESRCVSTHRRCETCADDSLVSQNTAAVTLNLLKGLVGERGFEPPPPGPEILGIDQLHSY